jgi:hypothetical protein
MTDHIFANAAEICSKAVPKSIVCSDHNLVAISKKTKVAIAGPYIVCKRSYNKFCSDSYVVDVKDMCWSVGCNEEQPHLRCLGTFMKWFIPVTNKHAPINKMTVKMVKSQWFDEEFKHFMVERDEVKGMVNKSGCTTDWKMYCKCGNHVTKLNKKKTLYYEKYK